MPADNGGHGMAEADWKQMNEDPRPTLQAVADAARSHRQGQLSRRRFLQLCAAAGLGMGGLLTACRREAPVLSGKAIAATVGPQSAVTSGSDQKAFLRDVGRSMQGTTLHVVSEDTPPCKVIRGLMLQEFEPLTGIHVEWELHSLGEVLSRVTTDVAQGSGHYDIYYCDHSWLGLLHGEAADPRELLGRADLAYPDYRFDDILAPLVEHTASYRKQLVGIPFDIPILIMMYRKDVLHEFGLKPPRTLADYLTAIRTIHRAKAPALYGTTGQWKSGHYALECEMTAWLWAHGGSLFGADKQPTLGDERAEAALAYMLELGNYMPKAVSRWDWQGQAQSFRQGLAGLYLGWSEYFPSFDDPKLSKIVGLAEAAAPPRELSLRQPDQCGFDEAPGISHQGGSCMMLSRRSRHVDAAWIFLQWATSADVTARASLLGGGATPTRRSSFDDPRIRQLGDGLTNPLRHFPVTLDAIEHRMGTEPHFANWPQLSLELAVELGRMTTGQQTLRQTLQGMDVAARRAVKV